MSVGVARSRGGWARSGVSVGVARSRGGWARSGVSVGVARLRAGFRGGAGGARGDAGRDARYSRAVSSSADRSRISILRTFPVTVIGNSSTTWTYRGIL